MKIITHIFKKMSSDEGYRALFKGAIALAALYLVAMAQVSSIMLPIEKSAYESRYKVEAKSKIEVESFDKLACDVANESTYVDCKMAKYQRKISSNSMDTLLEFQKLVQLLAGVLISMSIVGFLLHPFMHAEKQVVEEVTKTPSPNTPEGSLTENSKTIDS
ncbi:hypothetical protein DX883_13415 [Vibrio fluvialis]|nr:hypothetical protein [Vibrio fluvialis]